MITHNETGIKRCEIKFRIFWFIWKVCRRMSTYPNAHAKVKKSIFNVSSQDIRSILVSFLMIFEALQSELFKIKFQLLSSEILQIPEFNLHISCTVNFYQTISRLWLILKILDTLHKIFLTWVFEVSFELVYTVR